MPYRKHIYAFLIFIFTLLSGAHAQETADYRVLQSQSNDTLYLKFELRRTSATPLLLGGYNLVFKIDPTVVDTNNFVLVDQGRFGSSTINYTSTQILKLNSGVFQVAVSKRFPIAGIGLLLLDNFQNVGIAAFKIKKCGASGLSFPTKPLSSVIDWVLNDVTVTSIPPSTLTLSSKVSPKPVLTASKAVACVGSSVDFVADSNILFSNYTLFRRSETGLVSALSAAQAKSVFKNVVVSDTASYFVTFDLGTCKDTSTLASVFTAPQPLPVTISASNNTPCLEDAVTYTATPQVSGNKYVWKLSPIGTSAVFVGASAGLNVSSVQVDFKGTVPYSATLTVQDTNSFGCASPVVSREVNPVSCTFNADFEVNGSNFAVSACQSADVSFKDASTVSGGLSIVKWEWDFGPGAVPDTFSTIFSAPDLRNIPPVVKYTTAGVVGVRLIVTNNLGAKDTIVKSPTISVLAGLTETPLPSCGSSSCNEVNFNWALVQGATNYQVRYKKGKNGVFQPYQNVGIVNTFKVNSGSAGMGGTLNFNDTNNDTVYFQVRALASTCDTTTSNIVFCKPSYCTTEPGCSLPPISIIPPVASCKGSVVQIKVVTTPNDFTVTYPNVAFSWDNGKFDTSHVYNAFITDEVSQNVKLLVIDTLRVNCYSLNTISVPVTPVLTSKPDLGIQSLECDKVTFVWKHVEGAAKYQIKYSGTCIAAQDWIDAPLNGLAEFFEISNLTDSCKLNFNVRAVGGCNTTQSDTLVAPPTCSCYIGHIPSSNTKSCALDTVRFSVTDFQIPNWLISWEDPITGIPTTPSKDSVYTFIPAKSDTIYRIKYTISNPTKATCNTIGFIYDTTGTPGNPAWAPRKDIFCINDAIYALNEFDVSVLENTSFLGNGIVKLNDSYYFDPKVAGLGTHIISHNACGSAASLPFKVVNTPCVSTVVDGGLLGQPEGLYTACDGTIYLSDFGNSSLFRYKPGDAFGIPELLLQSSPTSINESGNASNVRVGNTAGIVFDETTGDDVYFVDKAFNRIKKLEISKQKVTIVSGQNGLGNLPSSTVSAPVSLALGRFNGPWGLAIHPNADTLYVADEGNRLLKSITIKGNLANQLVRWRVGLLSGGINPPSRAKNSNIRLHNIAVDSGYVNISDYAFNYNISSYNFATDSVNIVSKKTLGDFADGFSYMQRKPDGVSPNIGDWTYFTDSENFALRRINRKNGYMETVAGNPPPNPLDGTSNGLPLTEAKFSDPGPIAFNIRGYIDILDRTGASGKSAVRRYYIPRWGETWTGFDTTYVAKCDRDTVRPVFGGGRLRVISGKDLTAVINDSIFAPKDTGQYLLGYYLKIGRCDTTFLKTVYVKEPPKVQLDGDTVCADSFLLKAQTAKDTTVRYKWFGPTKATAISASDTARSIIVKQTGDYYIGVYYGKNKQCSILDSAHVLVASGDSGQVRPTVLPVTNGINYPPDSVQICYGTTIDLSMVEKNSTQPKFKKFVWNTGDTTRNITAYPSADYLVTAIDSIGCEVKAKYRVVQDPLPNICIKATNALGQNLGWGKYVVSTFAGRVGSIGSANGIGGNARFFAPWGLTIYNDTLYVSDKNNLVRSISLKDAKVAPFIGKLGVNSFVDSVSNARVNAVLSTPQGIRFDKKGNLYVANTGANNIAKYDRAKNFYYAYAGSGTAFYKDSVGKLAFLNQPYDLEIDAVGNVIFTDNQNHAIRSIDYARNVTTLAGNPPNTGQQDGKGLSSSFNWPWGITIDPAGSIYVAEDANQTIRKIDLDSNVSLVAGAFQVKGSNNASNWVPTPGLLARFARPWNTVSDKSGNIFITDAENNLIRMLDKKGDVITIAGVRGTGGAKDGLADTARFSAPMALAIDSKTQDIYVADQNNHIIRKLSRNKVVYVCKGSAYQIADTCPKSTANFDIVWQKKTSTGISIVGNIAQPFTDTATYILTITPKLNGIACANPIIDSVVVKWNLKNKANLSVLSPTSTFVPCRPDTFKVTGTSGFGKYIWYNRTNTTYNPIDTTTTNTVTLKVNLNVAKVDSAYYGFIVQDPLTGCFDTTSLSTELKVKLYPRIIPNFIDSLTCVGNTTLFTPASVDSTQFSFNWDFGVTPLATSIKAKNSFTYSVHGTYQVQMIGWNKAVPSCKDTVTKSVRITTRPRLNLTINGLADTAKYCSSAAVQADLEANVVTDVNAAGGPFTFKWQETYPKGGKLDSSSTLDNTIARPQTRVGETSSLFGYKVTVTDSKNCVSRPDSVYARVSAPPIFTVSTLPLSPICKGQSVTLTPKETVPSTDTYSYKWDTSGVRLNLDADTLVAPLANIPRSNVSYNVLIKNLKTLCTSTIRTPIQLRTIKINFDAIAPQVPCSLPDTTRIVANVTDAIAPYQWVKWTNDANGQTPTSLFNYSADLLSVDARRDLSRVYQIAIKDRDGCADSAKISVPASIVQPPAFSITKGKDTVACVGGSVKVSLAVSKGTAPFIFTWTKTSEVNVTDPFNPIITPTASGEYVVSMTDANNCTPVRDTVTIILSTPPAFTVVALPLSPICKGQSVTLTPNETVPSTDTYSYKWDTSGVRLNLDADTLVAPLANIPRSNVSYNVLIKNLKTLCTSTIRTPIQLRTIKINFDPIAPLVPCSLPDTTRIVANVSNAILPYQWVKWTNDSTGKTPTSLFNYGADLLSVDARRDSSRVYKIVLKDRDGCTDSSRVTVPASIVQPPAFSITKGKDTSVCVSASVNVSLKVTKGTAPFTFTWTKSSEVNVTDPYNPVITPTASGTYVVTMTDANNCGQASETITITQYDMSVLATNDAITGLCKSSLNPNPSAKLEANVTNTPSASGATYTYTWTNIGTNTNLNTNSATVLNVANAGSYEVQVKNNLTGCVRRDTTSFKILNKPENLNLLTGIPSITCAARTISLSSNFVPPISSKADSITYRWKVGGNPAFQTANKHDSAIVATLSTTDVGNVTFKVYAQNKCGIDSSSKDVLVNGTPKPNSDLKGGAFCDTIVSLVASIVEDPTLNYKWSGPNNINTIISDDATRNITTKTPGKFWVLIYDKNNPGCNRLDSATIEINKAGKGAIQLVNGTANLDSIKVCFDVPVNLEMREATLTQAKFKTFVWNSGESTRSISAVGAKWFKVSATDSLGCVVTDSFKLKEEPRPVACIEVLNAASKVIPATNKQVNVCSGDLYTISDPCNKSSNGPRDSLIVTWQRRGQNGVLSTINPRGVTLTGSYTYIETITLKACPNKVVTDSVIVIERPNPTISIIDTAADPFICNNEVFGLSAQPATFVTYYWYKTPSTSTTGLREPFDTTTTNTTSPTIVSLSPNDNFTQIYEVDGVDQYGCVASSSTTVKAIFPIPALDFDVEINCLGIATKFTPDVVDVAKYEYRWDFGDPTTLLDVSPIPIESYLYNKAGTYKVRLSGQSVLSTKLCNNYIEKLVTIKDPAKLDLTINGVADTLKICGTANGVNLNAVINSTPQTWSYDWTEIAPLGGNLDFTNTNNGTNTAKPITKSGETTSLYGYSVQATDAKNCVSGRDTAYVRVSVAPEFELSLISNDTVCKAETISISAINQKPSSTFARYRYDWDTSNVDLGVNSANLVSKPKKTVTYRFTVTDSVTSCSIQKSVPITVLKPIVSISPVPNPTPCAAPDSIGIVAQVIDTKLPLQTIQWIDSLTKAVPTSLYNPNLLSVKAFRDVSRTYGLVIKDNIGCVDTTFVRVNASSADAPKFTVVNGSSRGSCVNTNVKVELRVITGRPDYTFTWTTDKNGTPATEVNTTDIFNPIISTSNISSYPKKFYVTFNDANKCSPALDSVEINQPADMKVNINGSAANICKTLANPNPSTSLEAIPTDIPSSTTSTYNYVWRNIETDQIVSSGSSFLNNVSSSGDYEVEVTNLSTSCVRKDTATVSILNAPENPVVTLLDPTISCNNQPVQLIATFNSPAKANKDKITFEWTVIGGSNLISSFDSSVVYIPNPSDIGDITFKVVAKNRCGEADTISLPKRLIAAAKAKLDVDAKEVSVNKNVIFTNNSTNTDSLVVLKITDGTNHNFGKIPGGTFNHSFSNKGTYKAKLYVINQNGCDAEDSVTITVIDKLNLFVPNVFSPTANDENNRFLRVYGVNISPQSFNFLVYNRWGQLVYSTSDLYTAMNAGWDGNDSNGESQMGVYTYILTGKFNTGASINQTGTVTLLR